MDKKGISKKVYVWIIIISILLLAVIGVAFVAFFKDRENSIKEKDSGAVLMTYSNETNSLSMSKITPIKDEDGVKLSNKNEYFDFTITTKIEDSISIEYEIAITPITKNIDILDGIKVYLERQDNGTYVKLGDPKKFIANKEKTKLGVPKGSMVVASVVKEKNDVDNYRLRIWIDENAKISEEDVKKLSFDVNVYGKANGN